MNKVRLSNRLSVIAGMVPEGHRLADIGCDHAWLPIRLVQDGRIPSALAMDVRKGPLSMAEEHIVSFGLQERIGTRLSDGLKELQADEADTIVIAGMGGDLILRILQARPDLIRQVSELILSPQSEVDRVRAWLCSQHFRFLDEAVLSEDGKWYFIMKVSAAHSAGTDDQERQAVLRDFLSDTAGERTKAGSLKMQGEDAGLDFSSLSVMFGPVLLARKDPMLFKWLIWRQGVLTDILKKLEQAEERLQTRVRMEAVSHELAQIEAAKKLLCAES